MEVSIIIPVYNAAPYLKQCIDSVLKQRTAYSYEVIAVNDGSTDESLAILKHYQDKITIIDKKNTGPGDSRNQAIKKARGNYLMFVDSDDYVSPYFVEHMLRSLLDHQADIVICDFYRVAENGELTILSKGEFGVYESGNYHDVLLMEFHSCNKIIKKSLLKKHPYPKDMLYEDVVSIAQCEIDAKKIVKLKEPLYYYRKTPNSTTNSLDKSNYDLFTATNMIEPYFLEHGYQTEIEYLYVNQILVDLAIKIIKSGKADAWDQVRQYRQEILTKYPTCFSNPYLKKERLMKRLYLFCLKHQWYFIIDLVYRKR